MYRPLSETLFSHHFSFLPARKVKIIESLCSEPAILSALAFSDFQKFSERLNRRMYGLENYLHDHGNIDLQFKRGNPPTVNIRDAYTHDRLWTSKEDCLGTVSQYIGFQYTQRDEKARGLNLVIDRANFDLSYAADCVDLEAVRDVILPYTKQHREPYYAAINDTLLALEGVEKPGYCPRSDNHLWGRFFNALATLYREFRHERAPVVLAYAPNKLPQGANIKQVTTIGSWEDKSDVVKPLAGNQFQSFEEALLKALRPNSVIRTIDDQQYAFAGEYDPFTAIGSTWLDLAPVPEYRGKPEGAKNLPTVDEVLAAQTIALGDDVAKTCGFNEAAYRQSVEEYVRKFVITPLNLSDKASVGKRGTALLKVGVPHNAPEGTINPLFGVDGRTGRVSMARQKMIMSLLPSEYVHFWDIVADVCKHVDLPHDADNERHVGWWLATKLVLVRNQAKTIMDGGRVLVRAAE